MNCSTCGDVCRCSPEMLTAALPQTMPNAARLATPVELHVADNLSSAEKADEAAEQEMSIPGDELTAGSRSDGDSLAEADAPAWRDELSARLTRYRARRKPRPPRYPSLRLRFEEPKLYSPADANSAPSFGTVSNHALALDGLAELPSASVDEAEIEPAQSFEANHGADPSFKSGERNDSPAKIPAAKNAGPSFGARLAGAKIIEFPRSSFSAAPISGDELAEPIFDRPRILEVPETTPPPPALGGITIEVAPVDEIRRQPGIDIPLQSAPLMRRIAAGIIDGLIVVMASGVFGAIFWKLANFRPPVIQMLGLAAGIPFALWVAYQYLLIVYSGGTPGLRAAGLHLTRFDGSPSNRRTRRWRVLASYLSAVSLGMGYAWLFLDEDLLCWHDRISHTYLAPKIRQIAVDKES